MTVLDFDVTMMDVLALSETVDKFIFTRGS